MSDSLTNSDRRARKEAALFEAALDVFSELGFRKAGVEEIAKRAGIANGTIYLYASSKRDLYKRVVEYGLNAWQASAAKAAESASASGAQARFEALCRAAYTYLEAEPKLRKLLARDPSLFPASPGINPGDDPFETVNRTSVELLKRAIVDGVRSGEFSVTDPTAAAELIFSLYRMVIERSYVAESGDNLRHFEAGLSIVLNGITAR